MKSMDEIMRHQATVVFALSVTVLLLTACDERAAEDAIVDPAFGGSELWDDGQAELAFYRLHRTRNQYGEAEEQDVVVGTYLVKHDYDPDREAKARSDAAHRVETFKYALFYELESGSYQYKRNYVINARRADLRPMKSSFTSFDWCSNLYRELAFEPNGDVRFLMRSDDYGNARQTFDYREQSFPPAEVPLLVRGLRLEEGAPAHFRLLLEDGEVVESTARLAGRDSITTSAGTFLADRIDVHYAEPVPSPIAEESDTLETYYVALDEARSLLRIEGSTGRYEMEILEHLRSPYWEEDVYERLERIRVRP